MSNFYATPAEPGELPWGLAEAEQQRAEKAEGELARLRALLVKRDADAN